MNSFELYGLWWIPKQKCKIFAGTLSFNPQNGGTLNLTHRQDDYKKISETFHSNITIINGIADNKEITLLNCKPSIKRYTDIYTTYEIGNIISGKHFEDEESTKATEYFLQISCMKNWLNKEVFKDDVEELFKYQNEQGEPTFKFLPKEIIKIPINNEIDLELHNSCDFKGDHDKYLIDKQPYILIKFAKAKSFNQMENVLYHLRDFFSLATSKPVYVKRLKSKSNSNSLDYNIEYFFRRRFGNKDLEEKLNPLNMIFNFKDLDENVGVESAFKNWFADYKELRHIYRMFFLTHYSKEVFEFKFLSLSQALDSYTNYYTDYYTEKIKNISKFIPKSEFKRRKKIIFDSLPPDESKEEYKKWLDVCLQNFISFNQRIELLITNELDFLNDIKNLPNLIQSIVLTRNALSHGYKDIEKGKNKYLINIDDFVWLFYGLKMILTSIFLKKIGFRNNKIKELFQRYFRYDDIINGKYVFD
ncbi:MAG: hypothetical protein KAW92_15115 [Candidatus Cloacimonetes bacterium]|nr:hypothetical protein [Candidatus Cloacimonadota bacterium]